MVNNIQGGITPTQSQQSQAANSTQATQQVQSVTNNRQDSDRQESGSVASIEDIRGAVQELNSRLENQQIPRNPEHRGFFIELCNMLNTIQAWMQKLIKVKM